MQSNQVRAFSLLLNISSVFVLCPWLLIFVFYSNRFIILHMGLQKGIASIWAKEKCNCASDLLLPCTLLLNSNVWMNQRVLQNNQSIKSIVSNIKKNVVGLIAFFFLLQDIKLRMNNISCFKDINWVIRIQDYKGLAKCTNLFDPNLYICISTG